MARLAPGDPAPPFSLPDHDGKLVSLADFAGQRVVVYFYPRDDTPGCTKEACQFDERRDAFGAQGTAVIGISADSAASHQRFRDKYSLALTLLTDADHAVMAAYGAWGEKTLYGKKTVGVIRSTFVISPDQTIERAYYQVRADGHAEKVLEALSA